MPGRLDILEYRPFDRKPRSIEKIDLRGATVTVRYGLGTLMIETASSPPFERGILLTDLKETHRFAEAVMQAAMSSTPTPSPPDDQLLG